MQIIISVFNWLKDIKNQRIILMAALVLFMLLFFRECRNSAEMERIWRQNTFALTDSMRTQKDKYDKLYYVHGITLTNIGELERINKKLYDDEL